MGAMASQITGGSIVCSTIYSGADQRKRQSSASLAFVRGIQRWPVDSPEKWPAARKMFPFDDVIMANLQIWRIMRRRLFDLCFCFKNNGQTKHSGYTYTNIVT